MLKKLISRLALRLKLAEFLKHPSTFNRLLGQALCLQWGRETEESFRRHLEQFFANLDRESLMNEIGFASIREKLSQAGGYKASIASLAGDGETDKTGLSRRIWRRRFGLLRHQGIRCDVLILREGEQIPPHGHYRIVSGFYLLEGEVAIRQYDRVREVGDKVLLRKAMDTVLPVGGYAANSEYHHNIHWLLGLAPASFLFRVTVSGTPTATFGGPDRQGERVYVDPTAAPDHAGQILAPYLTEQQAKRVPYVLDRKSLQPS